MGEDEEYQLVQLTFLSFAYRHHDIQILVLSFAIGMPLARASASLFLTFHQWKEENEAVIRVSR